MKVSILRENHVSDDTEATELMQAIVRFLENPMSDIGLRNKGLRILDDGLSLIYFPATSCPEG